MTGGGKDGCCFLGGLWWGVFFFGMHTVDLLQRAGNRDKLKRMRRRGFVTRYLG
jgi:hypothetical protein